MKIIKNKKAHNCQALIELRILDYLNNEVDIHDNFHIIRKFDHFYYKNHLCILFELLNENLYELLKQNYFQGLSLNSIRFIIKQILEAVYQLEKSNLIHCDLKPENILLKINKENKNEILIKVTDFGSACFKGNTIFQYIQSRYYRAPETILGYPYSLEIDIWSLGCIAAELFLGEPLFPGSSEYDQLNKILGFIDEEIPDYMLKEAKNVKKYFNVFNEKTVNGEIFTKYKIKNNEDYFKENPNVEEPKYSIPAGLSGFNDILKMQQNKKNANNSSNNNNKSFDVSNVNSPNNDLESFVHFLKGLMTLDLKKRWNAKTALNHPFITKEKFDGNFKPIENEEISYINSNNETSNSDKIRQFYFQGNNNNVKNNINNFNQNVQNKFQNNFNNINYMNNYNNNFYMNYNNIPNDNKNCYSVIMNNNYNNYYGSNDSESFTENSFNNNSSMDYSCYQPNICNIPLKMLKNFPYGKIDDIDLKTNKKDKQKNKFNLKGKNNQTFSNDNFNKLGNNSYMHDNSYNQNYNNYIDPNNFYNQNMLNNSINSTDR